MSPHVSDDAMTIELEAMATIGRVLTGIDDEGARARILRWALDRFASAGETPQPQGASPAEVGPTDPALSIDSVGDLFASPLETPGSAPVQTLVHDFVSDFRRLVVEWQGA
jgi:hypothetical protein